MGNKGFEAALAAIEMANLKKAVASGQLPVASEKQIPRRSTFRNDDSVKKRMAIGKSKKNSRRK